MSDGGNRIGTVSSVDPETGMVSVIFEDRDGEVTELLPYATFNEEYKLPQLGAKVVVMHLSNGGEMGIILGTYWNEYNAAGNPGTNRFPALADLCYGVLIGAYLLTSNNYGLGHDHEKRIADLEKVVGVGKGVVEWP